MAEYIERDAALNFEVDSVLLAPSALQPFMDGMAFYADHIKHIPAADVVPVRHGRWIDNKVAFYLGCSECGCYLEYAVDTFLDNGEHYHYCPNCGARMDVPDTDVGEMDGDGE